MKVNKN